MNEDLNPAPGAAAAPADHVAPAAAEAPEQAGYCIQIHVSVDNKLSVGVESDAQEAAEQPGAEAAAMSPAQNIKDALTQALQIYKAGGKPDATAEHARQLTSQGFATGYEED
jgi:hypothetical protein